MTDQPLVPSTNELLAAIHDLLLVIHIDTSRNYDLLYCIATGQSEEAVDALVNAHREGGQFAPPPFLGDEQPPSEQTQPEWVTEAFEGPQDIPDAPHPGEPTFYDDVIDLAMDDEDDKDPDS